MKTTVLFALFVAFLANQPPVRGSGQEAHAAPRQGEQPSQVEPPKIQQAEDAPAKPGQGKAGEKRRESAHKD